jgi:hypothetical protein
VNEDDEVARLWLPLLVADIMQLATIAKFVEVVGEVWERLLFEVPVLIACWSCQSCVGSSESLSPRESSSLSFFDSFLKNEPLRIERKNRKK